MTAGQILTSIKAKIGPGNIATDDQLLSWLNDAYFYICDAFTQENPDFLTTSDKTDLIQNQFEYWLPANCEKVVMVNVNFTGQWRRLTPLQEVGQVPHLADVTQPVFFTELNPKYYITGNKLGILPINTGPTVSGGIELWFVATPLLLTASDSPLFKEKYHYLIKDLVYADYLDLDDQHQAAEILRNRVDNRIEKAIASMTESQIDEPKSIEIVVDTELYEDPLKNVGVV